MITLLLISQAFALDTASLRSTATSDLFRDPYDYLLMPGVMAAEDERGLVTLLSAYGGAGRYALGYYGGAGPGVVGAAFDFGTAGNSSTSTNVYKLADAQTKTVSDAASSSSAWSGLLSYGMPLSDSLALGAALWISQGANTVSFDPSSGSVGGANTNIDVSDGDDTSSEGSASYKGRSLAVLVGGAMYSDSGYLSLDVGLAQTLDSADVEGEWEYVDTSIKYSGYVPGTAFSSNRKGLGPLAKLELVRAVGDMTDLRITADLSMASGEPHTAESKVVTKSGTDTVFTSTHTDELKNASWSGSSYGVLVALHVEGEDLSVRPGIRVRGSGYGETYTPYSSDSTEFDGTTTETESKYDTEMNISSLSLGLPLAVEVPLGAEEHWTLRMAGDWTWSRSKLNTKDTYKDEDVEYNETTTTTSTSTSSATDASIGLRFQPVDAMRLDAAAFGGTSFGGANNEAINIGSVWLSATLILQ